MLRSGKNRWKILPLHREDRDKHLLILAIGVLFWDSSHPWVEPLLGQPALWAAVFSSEDQEWHYQDTSPVKHPEQVVYRSPSLVVKLSIRFR